MMTDFLQRFESHLRAALGDPRHAEREPAVLLEASNHLATAGSAKRMRPLLVNHFGAAVDLHPLYRLCIATAAELIHTASLLHDDVIDEGTERRGRPTANARWNNSVAVLSGDLVLCIALEQLYELPRTVTTSAVELVAEMTRSAMLEVQARRARRWDLDDWHAIARGKTGALLAWCGRAPALAKNESDLARSFADCGHHLGLAFQITDDLIDVMSTDTGKNRFADLRQANPSFLIAAARQRDDQLCRDIDAWWDGDGEADELHRLARAVASSEAPRVAVNAVDDHLAAALDALGEFANHPNGRQIVGWVEQLRSIAHGALTSALPKRSHA